MQKRVFITHGYTAHSKKHWFPWLKARLENQGFLVQVFDMPNSSQPNAQEWLLYHQNEISAVYPTDIFIGHSLGCIATLRFLAQQNKKIGKLILVAGFDQHLPNLPELDDFTQVKLNYAQLISNISQRIVIASADDQVVNPQYTKQLAEHLEAEYLLLNGYKHFTETAGVTELQVVFDEINRT